MRYYSSEFRRLAVQLSDEIGNRDAARWLGLSYNTLSAWRKQKLRESDETSEISAEDLRQEVEHLREANAILRGALDRLLELKGN